MFYRVESHLFRGTKIARSALALLTLSMAAVTTTGCGSAQSGVSGLLSSIQVKSYAQNGDLWASLSAQLDTGNMLLGAVSVPIMDPKNPSVTYGSLSIAPNLCSSTGICAGGGTITIGVDVSAVAHVQEVSNQLPNGTMIPVGQAASAAIVALPLGNSGGKIYVALGQGIAMLGIAMPFKALDPVGQYAPGVDIFSSFTLGSVSGIVGLFTGSSTDTTGFGLFVDLSNLLNPTPAPTTGVVAAEMSRSQVDLSDESAAMLSQPIQPLILKDQKPSYSAEQAVYYKLWDLNSNTTVLHLH